MEVEGSTDGREEQDTWEHALRLMVKAGSKMDELELMNRQHAIP